jgi:ethanolamine ammonia-lyase large subunit
LQFEEPDKETKLRIANAAVRLSDDEAVRFIFDQMEKNLYEAFRNVTSEKQGESLWREVKVVKALREGLEWYANSRETLSKQS